MNAIQSSIAVWLGLLALLGASVAAATLVPGTPGTGLALACAFVMAGLIFIWFMGLRTADALLRVFALAAVLWLALLMGITLLDYVERGIGTLR